MTRTLQPSKLRELIKFFPHKGQQKVLENQRRFTTLCCGNRWGKSILAGYIALREALLNDRLIWICAPNYDLARKVYDYVVLWINKYLSDYGAKIDNSKLEITIGTSKICAKSAQAGNEQSLLGAGLNLLVADEFSRISKGIWEEYLRPRLVDKIGKAVFISSPLGKTSHFFDIYRKGLTDDPEYISFSFPTSDNPYISAKELEGVKKSIPEDLWKQNFLGEFLDTAATLFKGLDKIIKENTEAPPDPARTYVMGVDLGRVHDYSCISIFDRRSQELVYWDRFLESWSFTKERIRTIAERYNNARVIIDSTSVGSPIAEDLRRARVNIDDFVFSNKSKKELIEKLRLFIEQERIKIPRNEILIGELESFGFSISDSGNVIYSAPVGQYDDAVISLALGVWGLDFREPESSTARYEEYMRKKWKIWDRDKRSQKENYI